jgi:hypothetical protein
MNFEIFASGAITFGFLVVAIFFARFWYRTRDRLFGIFGVAFFLFAVERLFLLSIESTDELRTYVYLVRLAAYTLIIYAIVDKNRQKLN